MYALEHSQARVVVYDAAVGAGVREAMRSLPAERRAGMTAVVAGEATDADLVAGAVQFEQFVGGGGAGDDAALLRGPADEWDTISLNYTSGTTGSPKGVQLHHRGAYLTACSNHMAWSMPQRPVYLWTLPMFHCNGWCFPWTVAALAGTNVCLPRVEGAAMLEAIEREGVTHMCGAPVVIDMLLGALGGRRLPSPVQMMVAAAPPPERTLLAAEAAGLEVTHVYGLTEVYGPAVVCPHRPEYDGLPPAERARLRSRQGIRYHALEGLSVVHRDTREPVPRDGETLGEVVMRGNMVMKGYKDDAAATAEAFEGGWFRTGDLAVLDADGFVHIRDRAKDLIISGGENISSVQVENAILSCPGVAAVAVVAAPHPRWGETPCAFVERADDAAHLDADAVIAHCRREIPAFMAPGIVLFEPLPRTNTGKVLKAKLRHRASV